MKTVRITVAQAIVKFLRQQYVSRDGTEHRLIHGIAGIFGHGNVSGLGQAIEEYGGGELPFLQPKNEQAMVHMAVAFAKARKRLSTWACTTSVGPGATNMVTGAALATVNRLPVLLLPGDVFASRRPDPVLQQLEHPQARDVSVNDCFRPVSQFWDRITRPEQILRSLPEAMRVLADPAATGAVTLALPEDVQAEAFDCPVTFFAKRVQRVARPVPDHEALEQAAKLLKRAKHPLIVAGGGVHYSDAAGTLEKLSERHGIPVCVTQAGKGALLEAHPQGLGAVGVTGTSAANAIAGSADLVLAVGTRLSDFTTASKTLFKNPAVKFVGVNVCAADASKHGAIPIVADAKVALKALSSQLGGWRAPAGLRSTVRRAKQGWQADRSAMIHPKAKSVDGRLFQSELLGTLNEVLDGGCTVVHAAGGIPGDIHKLWEGKSAADYHSEYGYSCMGYEIAGALGVKLAAPNREVFALVGDGSYLMMNHELVTSIQEHAKITVILADNGGYGCIHNLQRACGGRSFGNEFRHRSSKTQRLDGKPVFVDFAGNARSLGAEVFTAATRTELLEALDKARHSPTTCLIYVPVSTESVMKGYAWWDVPPAEKSGVESVRNARSRYERMLRYSHFYY